MSESTQRLKSTALTTMKLALAGGLIYWLWSSGKLDVKQMSLIYESPLILTAGIGFWLFTNLGLGSLRWHILLHAMGYKNSFAQTVKLQHTGLFFNTALPGAIGGDVVKATYLILDHKELGKSPAMTAILMDRILGFLGMFSIGAFSVLFNLSEVLAVPALRPVVIGIFALILVAMFCLGIVFKSYRGDDPILKILGGRYPGAKTLVKIYTCFRQFRPYKGRIFAAWLLSLFVQGCIMIYFYVIATQLLPGVELSKIALVYPVGILITALPLAPGGLGVGHIAFENLFGLFGYSIGADTFNIFVVSWLVLNLTGIFSYLTLKKKADPSQLLQTQQQDEKEPCTA